MGEFAYPPVAFETHPEQLRSLGLGHQWQHRNLTMHIKEDHPMWDGLYDLKLNSYDLAVDIELHDAVNDFALSIPKFAVLS